VKILVCGSRHWSKRDPIERELRKLAREGDVVIHGAHWSGADAIVDIVARNMGFVVRRYPAEWARYGRSAGPRRNTQMLSLEHLPPKDPIDYCLAFAEDFSKAFGTCDMRRKAELAGIRTVSFTF
jgi:YspA, cpYpsA-related SLOG family